MGFRYRLHQNPMAGFRRSADILFRPEKVAVVVHGCYWHGCPQHATTPRTNTAWWRDKLDRNVQRDNETAATWASHGWLTIVVWEHEDPSEAAARVASAVTSRRHEK